MSLDFFRPVEHWGRKFDRGSVLFEFSALREPEATRFPAIGAWLRAKGIEFNAVPTPQMLWRGRLWPDLFIANQLEALPEGEFHSTFDETILSTRHGKHSDDYPLYWASRSVHGEKFHWEFIEPLCRKITGRPSSEIAARYHRAIWIPLYWPQTLRARKSIPTAFHYPRAGYAGCVIDVVHGGAPRTISQQKPATAQPMDAVEIAIAYLIAQPKQYFSVAFIVDESPIYRVTDQDVCAGLSAEHHRLVVEYRGECNVAQELERLGLTYHPMHMAFDSLRFSLPTIANVARGWRLRPHLNAQLWQAMGNTWEVLSAESQPR